MTSKCVTYSKFGKKNDTKWSNYLSTRCRVLSFCMLQSERVLNRTDILGRKKIRTRQKAKNEENIFWWIGTFHPQAAFQQKSASAGREEFPPCLGFSLSHFQSCRRAPPAVNSDIGLIKMYDYHMWVGSKSMSVLRYLSHLESDGLARQCLHKNLHGGLSLSLKIIVREGG